MWNGTKREAQCKNGVGNRLTRTVGAATDTYAYSPTANQISTITTGSNVRSFTYLASGQVSQDVRDPSDTYTFTANDNGRMEAASLNGSPLKCRWGNRVESIGTHWENQLPHFPIKP